MYWEHFDNVGSSYLKLIQYLPIGWSKQSHQAPFCDQYGFPLLPVESCFWLWYIQSFTKHHFISTTKANLGAYCQQFWFRICCTSTYTVISHNFQCCLILFKILRPAKRVNAESEAYIPHWEAIIGVVRCPAGGLSFSFSSDSEKDKSCVWVSTSAQSFLKGFLTNSQLITVLISLCNVLITRSFSAFDLACLSVGEGFLW